jgi:hypothetical protein
MSSTSSLRIVCMNRLRENQLNIHPNEGADIGLMTTQYSVRTSQGEVLEINLMNDCPKECIELSSHLWDRLVKPQRVRLDYEGGTLRIEKA